MLSSIKRFYTHPLITHCDVKCIVQNRPMTILTSQIRKLNYCCYSLRNFSTDFAMLELLLINLTINLTFVNNKK